jgi:serine phosphatase RsbU (regulator of sigma subunit)
MQFICAGHPPILLRHADGQIEHLGAALNIPLGVEETFAYHQEEQQLMAGDTLLLYSDGTYERRDRQGAQFGLLHLERLFAATPGYPEAVIQAIQTALDTFSDVKEVGDDTTLLCAQVR